MFRKLRQQYQKDLDYQFLKQFNKSSINLRCNNQKSRFVIKNSCQKLIYHCNLNQISYLNVTIRFRNSLKSNTMQDLEVPKILKKVISIKEFLTFFYPCLIIPQKCIREQELENYGEDIQSSLFLMRYQKHRQEQLKLNLQTRLLYLGTPKIHLDTTKRRRRNGENQFKLSTFAEYIDAQDKQESKTKRSEDDKFKKSPVYQSFKYNDVRICRLLKIRNNSVPTSIAESPLKVNQQAAKINRLPPLLQVDRRMQRVYSNFCK